MHNRSESGEAIDAAGPGGVVLPREPGFHAEKRRYDPAFDGRLAALGDVYVNDAFGSAPGAASTERNRKHVQAAGPGLLMGDEIAHLGKCWTRPSGRSSRSSAAPRCPTSSRSFENLIPRVDALLIGGAMAYTFLKARGARVGQSLVEEELLDAGARHRAARQGRNLRLSCPVDHVVARSSSRVRTAETLKVGDAAIGERMGSISVRSRITYRR
jgi:phosphoglycerate kinase